MFFFDFLYIIKVRNMIELETRSFILGVLVPIFKRLCDLWKESAGHYILVEQELMINLLGPAISSWDEA